MTALFESVRLGFVASGIPEELINELLGSFEEAKQRFYRDDLRPTELEGGRFSEAVFRVLQWATTSKYVKIGKKLPSVDQLIRQLESASGPDSVRLHIPRTLRLIYDIRNKRNVGHLADGIDPNVQDASLVIHNMEWVLAELVRLYHNVSAQEAHGMIADLVSKEVPAIQVFDGFPRLLKSLTASDHFLVLLYWCGASGATLADLIAWARPSMRGNARRTLSTLDKKDLIHLTGDRYVLTRLGERRVETQKFLEPL